jgi:cell shape-determining protein MreC
MESVFRIKSQINLLLVIILILFFEIAAFWHSSVIVVPSHLVLQTSQEEVAVGELIPSSLKRVKDYPSELETKTLKEIIELPKDKGEIAQKAKKLKKLVEQQKRLTEKY